MCSYFLECFKIWFYESRMGTCGGIGLEPGTVVVTKEAVDGRLRSSLDMVILGKVLVVIHFTRCVPQGVSRESVLDQELALRLVEVGAQDAAFPTILGKTITTDDFYEGQVGSVKHAFICPETIMLGSKLLHI